MWKLFWCFCCYFEHDSHIFSLVSTVDFEQVNVGWVALHVLCQIYQGPSMKQICSIMSIIWVPFLLVRILTRATSLKQQMYRFCQTTRSSFFYGCSFQDSFIPPSSVLFLLQKCLIWLKNAWNQNANSLYFRTKKLLNIGIIGKKMALTTYEDSIHV